MAGRQDSWTIIAAFAAFIAAAPAVAQTDDPNQPAAPGSETADADDAAESPPPTILKAISVTATRNPIEAFEYPGMVTVVGPERFRRCSRRRRTTC